MINCDSDSASDFIVAYRLSASCQNKFIYNIYE